VEYGVEVDLALSSLGLACSKACSEEVVEAGLLGRLREWWEKRWYDAYARKRGFRDWRDYVEKVILNG